MAVHAHPTPLRPPAPVVPATLTHAGSRILVATAFSAGTGIVTGILMPRGPVTPAQALALLAIALVGGFVAGRVLASRWAMLLAPLAHLAAVEITRLAETGPTVDGLHLTSTFGIIAFIFGRSVYLLLGLVQAAQTAVDSLRDILRPSLGGSAAIAAQVLGFAALILVMQVDWAATLKRLRPDLDPAGPADERP